jgi:hypothetical protein
MDLTLFLVIAVVIIFIYYLISVIKDLQMDVNKLSMSCSVDKTPKNIETLDIKIKNDLLKLLDYIRVFFI